MSDRELLRECYEYVWHKWSCPQQAESRAASAVAPCEWNEDCEGCWTTGCGEMFYFNDGTPEQNNARFCHGCGHPVSATKYVDPPIEDDAASGEAG